MDEVNFALLTVWRCVEACCLLLDVLIRTLKWLLCSVSDLCCSLHSTMLALCGSDITEYGNFALFSFLTATEVFSSAVHGALGTIESWLQTLGGVFESSKMIGHLLCHVAWRAKDLLQRGFILGTSILRQTCDALCIALSLAVYFVNTVVNMLLITTQNCVSMLAGVWEAVAAPVHKAVELTLTVLTFLYSCLVGVSVLLWTPCQLLLDFITALTHVIFSVLMADTYILTAAMVMSLGLLMLNPRFQVLMGQPGFCIVNALHRVQVAVQRVYVVIQEQALSFQAIYSRTAQDGSRTQTVETSFRPAEADPLVSNEPQLSSLPGRSSNRDSRSSSAEGRTSQSQLNTSLKYRSGPLTDGELLSLLKEQEERKKCVICQDSSKTVLLLPCRHLCLCRHCTDILTQRQHVQQRCCPLCRQHITQTMEVFL
ncbi:E3 ubiquitin-protein ligase RNF26-like [Sphaeramia orbicularis]|uniref:E3 ubiquitin-protein ligase RNF26 n=1 Tax=Sphaeramia orbicularis TaxID=375764 RepID=A0A672Y522_9TELE|nr:E3 ubiquitin-protein ligase RNF26-like [Sphaeramia orbicularis]